MFYDQPDNQDISDDSVIENTLELTELINHNNNKQNLTNNKNTKHNTSSSNIKKLTPTKPYDFIPEYARNYLFYLINVQNKSEKTVYEYYLDLRTFFRFVVQTKNLTSEDNFDLVDASNCPVSVIEKTCCY